MTTSIITVANQKGGVAKTTSACNIGAAYALLGHKVLLIDLDHQGNLTSLVGVAKEKAYQHCISHAVSDGKKPKELIVKTNDENLDIIPCTHQLSAVGEQLRGEINQFHFLKEFLESSDINEYEIVIIDTHPDIDLFFKAAMVASHYYIIPLFAEKDSGHGLARQIEEATKISRFCNPMLLLLGTFITKFDKLNATHVIFAEQIEKAAKASGFHVFKTKIPMSRAVAGASASSMPLTRYKKNLAVSQAYGTLAGEVFPLLKGKRTGRKTAPVNTSVLGNYEIEQTVEL